MLRNYLIATFRNLMRNKLYAAINIVGLAAGLAAAILIALFVRDEFSYDRFIPGYERTYLVSEVINIPGHAPILTPATQARIASLLKLDFPVIESIARLNAERRTLRYGEVESNETLYWADPDIFNLLPLKTIAGELTSALQSPDSLVITRRMARKYFHRDNPIGQLVEVDRQYSLRVTAVLEDLPSNTHLDTDFIASGRGPHSELTALDTNPSTARGHDLVYTYLRLVPGASSEAMEKALPAFVTQRLAKSFGPVKLSLPLVPLSSIHLTSTTEESMKAGGDVATIYAVSTVGILIVLLASINFVNLMTARAGRRAVEIGIRKVTGATRWQLVVQFIGESVLYASVAMLLAVVLVELLLPGFNAFLGRTIRFAYASDPALVAGLVFATLIVGSLAGAYPALILSSFSPIITLKSGAAQTSGSASLRQTFVLLQFAILIGLLSCTLVVYRQNEFAMNDGMRLNKEAVLLINTSCRETFKEEVLKLPEVWAAACAYSPVLNMRVGGHYGFTLRDLSVINLDGQSVDLGFFELYGLRPIAGRFFSSGQFGDVTPAGFYELNSASIGRADLTTVVGRVVINETAVRAAGFASAQAAIGQRLSWVGRRPVEVIGVVRDFSLDSIHQRVAPTFYAVYPPSYDVLSVKLSGRELPRTLDAIDALWKTFGDPKPLSRMFLDQHLQTLYIDVARRAETFAAFATIALLVACLGLFGLSAQTAERRTKEIGIRKALGASTIDVLRLLLWQFTKPVLWANLIAWPVAAFFMNRWLHGFAYHIDIEPWFFLASTALALFIALLTVSAHCYLVAREKPVRALRYE